jgi:hypothetical protein
MGTVSYLHSYHIKTDGWHYIRNSAALVLGGTWGAGNSCEFGAHRGPRGLVTGYATGGTPAYYRLDLGATSLPNANIVFLANQLSSRAGGIGFKIRIIGCGAGSSGTISEHIIVANSGGTTPSVYLADAPSFTPRAGDKYEILSGSVAMVVGGAAAANDAKFWEVSCHELTAMGAQKPAASGTDAQLLCLDELYVPSDRSPGDGLLGVCTATGSAAGTLTGQAVNTLNDGDANVAANEFRNFQIRIVEDTVIPTAVGQRRAISSHTAGASPVYTLASNWAVTPSTDARYVIEYPNWWLWQAQGQTICHVFQESGYCAAQLGASAWSAALLTGRAAAAGAGLMLIPGSGCIQDNQIPVADAALRTFRYSQVHSFRGGAVKTLDIIDIAAQSITATVYDGGYNFLPSTGASYAYDPVTNDGEFAYINIASQFYNYRYDVFARRLTPWTGFPVALGAMVVGQRMACLPFVDGDTKIARLFMLGIGAVGFYDIIVTGY